MILTKTFSADEYARALEAWRWIGVEGKTPVLTSLFGDVFLQDAAGYWFLDTLEGTLTLTWSNRDEVQAALESEEGQDNYLMGAFAENRERAGVTLGPSDVYAFTVPPRLGGYGFDVDDSGNVSLKRTP